jgi:hypothetical protein
MKKLFKSLTLLGVQVALIACICFLAYVGYVWHDTQKAGIKDEASKAAVAILEKAGYTNVQVGDVEFTSAPMDSLLEWCVMKVTCKAQDEHGQKVTLLAQWNKIGRSRTVIRTLE